MLSGKKIFTVIKFICFRFVLQVAPDWFWALMLSKRITALNGRVLSPRAHAYLSFLSKFSGPKDEWTVGGSRLAYQNSTQAFDGPQKNIKNIQSLQIVLKGRVLEGRLYDPRGSYNTLSSPAIVFFHGGGGVIGSINTYDRFCRRLAITCNIPVICVGYRLAPEHPFPASVDDACDFWEWLQKYGTDFNINSQKVSVVGDSFGGNLALAVCLKFSSRVDTYGPSSAVLVYPPVEALPTSRSRKEFSGERLLFNDALEWFEEVLFPVTKKNLTNRTLDKRHLKDCPPTLIFVCGFDSLRDDGLALVNDLRRQKVDVQCIEYKSMFHGFLTASSVFPEAQNLLINIKVFIKKNFK